MRCGFRFFAYDHAAIIIDGGYRAYLGQAPFRDFLCPIGPALFWMLAAFFKWFGVTYAAYVGLGSVLNAAAAGMVFWTAWRRESGLGLAAAAGLITAVWLMPVSLGNPTYTSGAFFFVLAAACLLMPWGQPVSGGLLAAGTALALAFSIKQPVGLAAAFFLGLHVIGSGKRHGGLLLAGGFFGGVAGLALGIGPAGWENAWRHFFVLPMVEGLCGRFAAHAGAGAWLAAAALASGFLFRKGDRSLLACAGGLFLAYLLGGRGIREGISVLVFLPLAALPIMGRPQDRAMLTALTLTGFCSAISSGSPQDQSMPLIGLQFLLICPAWRRWRLELRNAAWAETLTGRRAWAGEIPVWGSFIFIVLLGVRSVAMTRWNALWALPVAGPAVGLTALWLGHRLWSRRRLTDGPRGLAVALAVGCLSSGLALIGRGAMTAVAMRREPFMLIDNPDKAVPRPLSAPFFHGLKLPPEEARALDRMYGRLAELAPKEKPFFIFQEKVGTTLYAALGQAPPQPFVSLDPGLTHSGQQDYLKVCRALMDSGVRTVAVAGEGREVDTDPGFSCLKRWLQDDFVEDRPVDDWAFYRRRTAGLAGGAGWRRAAAGTSREGRSIK
ncbi:MAG: hypothetical protein HY927_08600 [Elusimicrobia bacterium]|nr:hypothetical protein [Elusimicrobiota bacterium]